jgi:hypothetical protein
MLVPTSSIMMTVMMTMTTMRMDDNNDNRYNNKMAMAMTACGECDDDLPLHHND